MTHKAKDCVERPRKKGAKYSGKDIKADELIVVSQIHDHKARCKSYDIAYEACAGL